MRGVISIFIASAAVLLVVTGPLSATECPPPPCNIEGSEKSICELKADWILELYANGIIDNFGRQCGLGQTCNRAGWSGGAVTFSGREAKIVKIAPDTVLAGVVQGADNFSLRINSASFCWEASVRLPHDLSGKRVRFYGSNKHGASGMITPGYFAYEVIK
ncbi:MAG: hypothetical protein K2Y40_13300 [Reyranella sp.]|jgi:hypothetical protein|nr:hypothetical protein [Reyranella sp.]